MSTPISPQVTTSMTPPSTTTAISDQSHLVSPTESPFTFPTWSSSSSSSTHTAPPLIDPIQDGLSQDFPDLKHLTQEDLQALLTDEALFQAYLNTTPQALQQHRLVEQALQNNIQLARKNDELRPQLEALRKETLDRFESAKALRERSGYLTLAQEEYYRRFTPQVQLSRLAAATSTQEYTSEHLVNAFWTVKLMTNSLSNNTKASGKSFIEGPSV